LLVRQLQGDLFIYHLSPIRFAGMGLGLGGALALLKLETPCMQASSKVIFPSQRMSNKAMQAVKVEGGLTRSQPYTFSFCMERVDVGPYKVRLLLVFL